METLQTLSFGVLLKHFRRTAGLTQEALAERAGYSAVYVRMLERGARTPLPATIDLLATALALAPSDRQVLVSAARRRRDAPSAPRPAAATTDTDANQPEISSGDRAMIQVFLIADLRGYTHFTLTHGDEAAARLTMEFAALAETAVGERDGRVVELRGDEALVVFGSARQALHAAIDLQARWAELAQAGTPLLPMGIGLDAGEAVAVGGGYRGTALNLAARLCSVAGPGEVLATEEVIHLAGHIDRLLYRERGPLQLKGFAAPVQIIQVTAGDMHDGESRTESTEQDVPVTVAVGSAGRAGPRLPVGAFLGAVPASPMVAREGELKQALTALDEVVQGPGRLVLLTGEPGVGKTRLAQEVAVFAQNRDYVVTTGRCYEAHETAAYYPFVEVLTQLYATATEEFRAEIPRRWPDVARLLPDLDQRLMARSHFLPSSDPSGARSSGLSEQLRLFWAVTELIKAFSEARPVAVLIDDLHWADGASLELLEHLVRRTRNCRVLFLGTYRNVDIARRQRLQVMLRAVIHDRLVERIEVRRMGIEGTVALVAAIMKMDSDEVTTIAEAIYRRTDGNPFFTQEVLRSLVERGEMYRQEGRWVWREGTELDVPETIRLVIGERFTRLSEPAQVILHEASVLGQTFEFETLQAMSARSEAEVEAGLEEAVTAGLVREVDRVGYSFNHALTQQALYAELPARRKRRLHLAAGEALEHLPERMRHQRAAELAMHYLEAGEPARALPFALQAGRQAQAVYAQGEAERHFRLAVELAHTLNDDAHEAEAREQLGGVLGTLARYDEALEALDGAERAYLAVRDREGQARTVAELGWVHALRGTPEEGISRVHAVLETPEASTLSAYGHAALYIALAQLFFVRGQYDEQLAAADHAVDLARSGQDKRLLAQAKLRLGTALVILGRQMEASQMLREVIPLAEESGDLWSLAHALNMIASGHYTAGRFKDATQYYERALAVAERLGDPVLSAFMMSRCGDVAFLTGKLNEAREIFERAVAIVHQVGPSWRAAYPLGGLGELCLSQGQWEAASRYLDECIADAERSGDLQALRDAQGVLAERELLEGHPEAARARLEPLLADRVAGAIPSQQGAIMFRLPMLAWAYIELGNEREAATAVMECLTQARAEDARIALVDALRVHALLACRREEWSTAEEALEESLALARAMPYPYAEAKALYLYGQLHVQRGEARQARARLSAALEICGRLGERLYAERIERALAEVVVVRKI